MEMERIIAGAGSDVTHASFSDSWNKLWTPRIMTQARSESSSNTRLRTVLESMEISFGNVDTLSKCTCIVYSKLD